MEHANPLLVQVLEPGLCSPPSPTPSRRPQLWNINLTFFLVFLFLHYFSFFSLFSLVFSIFQCPNNGFACSMLTTVAGGSCCPHSGALVNLESIYNLGSQATSLFPRSRLIAFFGNAFKPVILGVALCWHQKCFKWAILNKEFNRKKTSSLEMMNYFSGYITVLPQSRAL